MNHFLGIIISRHFARGVISLTTQGYLGKSHKDKTSINIHFYFLAQSHQIKKEVKEVVVGTI